MKKTTLPIAKFSILILTAFLLFNVLLFSSCEKGETGPAGANGSSNVQSYTFTTNNLSWVFNGSDNSYNSTYNLTSITSDVVSNGTIQVFVGDGSSNQWGALPLSYSVLQLNYSYSLGQVVLSVTLSNGLVPNNPGGQQFKVVVIPPSARIAHVNMHNYSDVKAAYNLKD
jgi:hypothetical protein